MYQFFANLDRRWVFLLMFLAVALPTLLPIRPPEKPSQAVIDTFRVLNELPEGSRILMAFDFDPAGRAELQPMAAAFTRHAALKNHKLYFLTLWPPGPPLVEANIDILRREFPDYVYGRDYVNLGFRAGLEGVIRTIVADLRGSFGSDVYGTSLANIPMTSNLKNIQAMDLIISVSAGTPGTKEWVQYAATPYGMTIISGVTGVQAPLFVPYVPNQLQGLLGGVKAAAEYEQLLIEEFPQLASNPSVKEGMRRMGPQLVAHLLMVLLIIAGNVIYFTGRRRGPDRWPAG